MPVAVVKLGSSIVAEDTGALRLSVVARICEEVAALHAAGVDVVVVTSGAIARGIHLLGLDGRPRAVEELQAASAVGQGRLYRTYDENLRERGIQSAQVLLTFFDMSARTHYLNARRTLRKLVEWRIVPVINENDTTTTDEISFGDNDFLAAQVAVLVDASLLLLLTSHARADDRRSAGRSVGAAGLPVSDPAELEALSIGSATSPLGSGGMRSKVAAAEMATAAGHPDRDRVRVRARAAGAGVGGGGGRARGSRRIRCASPPSSSGCATRSPRRGGSRSMRAPRGRCATAGRHCCRSGSSGSTAPSRPATRSTCASTARAVGKGISNYSAAELTRVMGLKSATVREVLPRATEEAVHRDYFVLV